MPPPQSAPRHCLSSSGHSIGDFRTLPQQTGVATHAAFTPPDNHPRQTTAPGTKHLAPLPSPGCKPPQQVPPQAQQLLPDSASRLSLPLTDDADSGSQGSSPCCWTMLHSQASAKLQQLLAAQGAAGDEEDLDDGSGSVVEAMEAAPHEQGLVVGGGKQAGGDGGEEQEQQLDEEKEEDEALAAWPSAASGWSLHPDWDILRLARSPLWELAQAGLLHLERLGVVQAQDANSNSPRPTPASTATAAAATATSASAAAAAATTPPRPSSRPGGGDAAASPAPGLEGWRSWVPPTPAGMGPAQPRLLPSLPPLPSLLRRARRGRYSLDAGSAAGLPPGARIRSAWTPAGGAGTGASLPTVRSLGAGAAGADEAALEAELGASGPPSPRQLLAAALPSAYTLGSAIAAAAAGSLGGCGGYSVFGGYLGDLGGLGATVTCVSGIEAAGAAVTLAEAVRPAAAAAAAATLAAAAADACGWMAGVAGSAASGGGSGGSSGGGAPLCAGGRRSSVATRVAASLADAVVGPQAPPSARLALRRRVRAVVAGASIAWTSANIAALAAALAAADWSSAEHVGASLKTMLDLLLCCSSVPGVCKDLMRVGVMLGRTVQPPFARATHADGAIAGGGQGSRIGGGYGGR